MTKAVVKTIEFYQKNLSSLLAGRCRFWPSCSQYAKMAFKERGFFRGAFLTCWRLLRCQPFCKGGVDLPPAKASRETGENKFL